MSIWEKMGLATAPEASQPELSAEEKTARIAALKTEIAEWMAKQDTLAHQADALHRSASYRRVVGSTGEKLRALKTELANLTGEPIEQTEEKPEE